MIHAKVVDRKKMRYDEWFVLFYYPSEEETLTQCFSCKFRRPLASSLKMFVLLSVMLAVESVVLIDGFKPV